MKKPFCIIFFMILAFIMVACKSDNPSVSQTITLIVKTTALSTTKSIKTKYSNKIDLNNINSQNITDAIYMIDDNRLFIKMHNLNGTENKYILNLSIKKLSTFKLKTTKINNVDSLSNFFKLKDSRFVFWSKSEFVFTDKNFNVIIEGTLPANCSNFCFSPDGSKVSYSDAKGSLYIKNIYSQKQSLIIKNRALSKDDNFIGFVPSGWTFDGRYIIYQYGLVDALEIYTEYSGFINADNKDKIDFGNKLNKLILFSSNSNNIMYSITKEEGTSDVGIVNFKSKSKISLNIKDDEHRLLDLPVIISPKGNLILYSYHFNTEIDKLYIMDIKTKKIIFETDYKSNGIPIVAFSDDERFVSFADDNYIYIKDLRK